MDSIDDFQNNVYSKSAVPVLKQAFRTNSAATWPVRTEAASLNNLGIYQPVLSYSGNQKV